MNNRICIILLLGALALAGRAFGQEAAGELSDPRQIYLYAQGLLSRGFYDVAQPELERFRAMYPDHELARDCDLMLIDCYKGQKEDAKTLEAIAAFRGKWGTDAVTPQLRYIEGQVNWRLKNYDDAMSALRDISSDDSLDVALREKAQYQLAMVLFETNRNDEAIEMLKQLSEGQLSPEEAERWAGAVRLSQEYVKMGRLDDAVVLLKRLLDIPGGDEASRRELELQLGDIYFRNADFRNASFWYERYCINGGSDQKQAAVALRSIRCQIYLESWQTAYDLCERWRTKYPNSGSSDIDMLQATAAERLCSFDKALELWTAVVNKDDRQKQEATMHVMHCLRNLQRDDEYLALATAYLEQYSSVPNRRQILFDIGQMRLKKDDYEGAVAALREAFDAFAGEPEYFFPAGESLVYGLVKLEKWQDAANVSRRLASTVGCPDAANRLYLAGCYALQANATDVAEKDFRNVLAKRLLSPELEYKVLYNLVSIRQKAGDMDGVLEFLPRMIAVSPADKRDAFKFFHGEILVSKKAYVEAEAVLTELVNNGSSPVNESVRYLDLLLQVQMLEKNVNGVAGNAKLFAEKLNALDDLSIVNFRTVLRIAEFLNFSKWPERSAMLWKFVVNKCSEEELVRIASYEYVEYLTQIGQLSEATEVLQNWMDRCAQSGGEVGQWAFSQLAEVNLLDKNYLGAIVYADKALACSNGPASERGLARASYVKAVVLYEYNRDYEGAIPYAFRCFLQCNDEKYGKLAMAVAAKCYDALGDSENAGKVRAEIENSQF